MKTLGLLCLLLMCAFNSSAQKTGTPGTFTAGDKTFLLNEKPFVIRAGEIHFPRIPREYWDHRIKLCKAMGMNAICIYLFWNFHEQQPVAYDFTGQKDVAAFVRLIQQNGMYCIVRPGPYACAEWDMGGLPWWLLKKKDLDVRTDKDAYFMEKTLVLKKGKYWSELLLDWRKDESIVGKTFQKLLRHPNINKSGQCLEIYPNEKDIRSLAPLS